MPKGDQTRHSCCEEWILATNPPCWSIFLIFSHKRNFTAKECFMQLHCVFHSFFIDLLKVLNVRNPSFLPLKDSFEYNWKIILLSHKCDVELKHYRSFIINTLYLNALLSLYQHQQYSCFDNKGLFKTGLKLCAMGGRFLRATPTFASDRQSLVS